MATNLIDLVTQNLPDGAVGKISALLGENSATTHKAVEAVVPSLLGGLLHTASTPSGAGRLAQMLGGDEGEKAGDILSNFGGMLGGRSEDLLSLGQKIVPALFGSNLGPVTDALAKSTGMKSSSILSLMGMLAPMVLGVLRGQTASQGHSVSALTNLLTSQKDVIARSAPAGLASALGLNGLTAPGGAADAVRRGAGRVEEHAAAARRTAETADQGMSWLKWAAPLALLALAGAYLLYARSGNREAEPQPVANAVQGPPRVGPDPRTGVREAARPVFDTPDAAAKPAGDLAGRATDAAGSAAAAVGGAARRMAKVSLPGGLSLDLEEGSPLGGIVKSLENPGAGGAKGVPLDGLSFEGASADVSPKSTTMVGNLATILKAFPAARVKIEAHTDNAGDPAANKTLSQERADAVKALLVKAGVPSERVATEGVGPDRPIAPNDTEEGQAKNRRIELAVVPN